VLLERSAACHVDELQSSADREHRDASSLGRTEQCQLPRVAVDAGGIGERMPFLAVELGGDIRTSGEDQAVHAGDGGLRRRRVLRRQQQRDAAGIRHPGQILLGQERRPHIPHPLLRALQVRRDTDQRCRVRAARNHGCAPSR
jgi:hypothetical protein